MNSTMTLLSGLNFTKVGLAIVLFLLVMVAIWIPNVVFNVFVRLKHLSMEEIINGDHHFGSVISAINCFAGGVLLTTGLLELLPEVLEEVEKAMKSSKKTEFHTGSFIVIFGILLIIYVEEIMYFLERYLQKRSSPDIIDYNPTEVFVDPSNHAKGTYETFESRDQHNANMAESERSMEHDVINIYVLIVALSIHSIFEGLAMGLQPDMKDTVVVFTSIFIHKGIIALTIGLKMFKSTMLNGSLVICSSIFACATPLGVFLGLIFLYGKSTTNQSMKVASGILQGLACGTILYIVFFEILPREFSTRSNRLLKILSLNIGVMLISVVLFVLG